MEMTTQFEHIESPAANIERILLLHNFTGLAVYLAGNDTKVIVAEKFIYVKFYNFRRN